MGNAAVIKAEDVDLVRDWFKRAGNRATGPVLPDGWIGRPGDYLFYKPSVHTTNEWLTVADDDTSVSFRAPIRVRVQDAIGTFPGFKNELIFEEFSECMVRCTYDEDGTVRELRYTEGAVCFLFSLA